MQIVRLTQSIHVCFNRLFILVLAMIPKPRTLVGAVVSVCFALAACSSFAADSELRLAATETTATSSETVPFIDSAATSFAANGQLSAEKPGVAISPPNLRAVPYWLDNLYRYNVNSISDLVTYRKPDGTLVQLFTFWSEDRRLHITQRDFPDGHFTTPIDVHSAVHGGDEALRYDSHNSSAIGVAPNGVIFVTGNHHASELNMAKSTTPYDISSFARMLPENMVAASEVNRVTYPSFFTHGRFLYFSYRELDSGQGAPRFRWMINRYDSDRDEWDTAVQLNTGIKLRMYVSNIAVSENDDSMHAFAIWRDDSLGGGVSSQRDYLHLYSTDGIDWRIANSNTVISAAQPLWYDNGVYTLPGYTGTRLSAAEKIWDTDTSPGMIARSAGVASIDESGRPHALVKDYSGTLHHHYWNNKQQKQWLSDELEGWQAQSYDVVSCPTDTGALLSLGDRITFRSLDPSKASYDTPVLLADGYTTRDYTLSVDKEAVKYGYISFLLTSNSHYSPGNHADGMVSNPQPAWIATFHCSQLHDATAFSKVEG